MKQLKLKVAVLKLPEEACPQTPLSVQQNNRIESYYHFHLYSSATDVSATYTVAVNNAS